VYRGRTVVCEAVLGLKYLPLIDLSDALESNVIYPFGTGLIGSNYDWNIGTVPQTQLDGATRALPAGHVVGGSTVINGMVWNRGNVDDFDAWDSLQGGNSGWSWNDLLPYFMRVRLECEHSCYVLTIHSRRRTPRRPTLAKILSQSRMMRPYMAQG
jgi:choline dehydrogenase-like flavoprotein